MNKSDNILCPFCGKKPMEYQGAHTDGEGKEVWDEMVQCHTVGCVLWGECFVKERWLVRAECNFKTILKKAYKVFRETYTKNDGMEIDNEFGNLGEPYLILNKIEQILDGKERE